MSDRMRRALLVLFACCMLLPQPPCEALAAPACSAGAYVLMDAGSGRVLCGSSVEREMSIASTTKIMTALVALEHSDLSERVEVKSSHLKEGSSMYLSAGEVLTMEELLYGLLLPSGNDAAECIADHCGGDAFVQWMNDKAAALGMTHTSFKNPSGLDAAGHYSCALDMAKLAACAMEDPTFVRIVSTAEASAGTRSFANHNKLLGTLQGCIGLKTGYTSKAGRTLVSCCERDGMRLIAVTLNDRSDWDDHAALYAYGFSAFHRESALRRGTPAGSVSVRGGEMTSVRLLVERSFAYPVGEGEELTTRYEFPGELTAPLQRGERVGEAVVSLDGRELARVGLICASQVDALEVRERTGFFARLFGY